MMGHPMPGCKLYGKVTSAIEKYMQHGLAKTSLGEGDIGGTGNREDGDVTLQLPSVVVQRSHPPSTDQFVVMPSPS
jgi:hypothetical protein